MVVRLDRRLELCRWPGSHFYVGDVPEWWLWLFYLAVAGRYDPRALRRHWRWAVVAGVGWVCVGLLATNLRLPSDELRCTFLAVGHGGCTVIETPDGRVLLYDAGAISGPDITRRLVAPFLWSRGIRRIDEVFLSHADLDHFNGLPALLDRFAVGQVTMTPTFADKTTPGVAETLRVLEQPAMPIRIVKAGDRVTAGDVRIDGAASTGIRTGRQRKLPQSGVGGAPRGASHLVDRRSRRAGVGAGVAATGPFDRCTDGSPSRQQNEQQG